MDLANTLKETINTFGEESELDLQRMVAQDLPFAGELRQAIDEGNIKQICKTLRSIGIDPFKLEQMAADTTNRQKEYKQARQGNSKIKFILLLQRDTGLEVEELAIMVDALWGKNA